MTKKQLVDLLNKRFRDEEEVFVKYEDDGQTIFDPVRDVKEIIQDFVLRRFEVLSNGEWVRYDHRLHFRRPSEEYKEGEWREIIKDKWSESYKCIVV